MRPHAGDVEGSQALHCETLEPRRDTMLEFLKRSHFDIQLEDVVLEVIDSAEGVELCALRLHRSTCAIGIKDVEHDFVRGDL